MALGQQLSTSSSNIKIDDLSRLRNQRHLQLANFSKTTNCTSHCVGSLSINRPGPASNYLSAVLRAAIPDPNGLSLYAVLPAEPASVLGVLSNFHLLNLFPQRSSKPSPVLSNNSNLLRSLSHF
uniref:Uncharacterized protein n=1 Tax=Rhodosorus marinus TaxID=101924 RepID=A0A7S2ZLK9_9RHOD